MRAAARFSRLLGSAFCLGLAWQNALIADSSLDGGQAEAYAKLGVGARALGMGQAQVAVADDAYAFCFNPAGLAQLKEIQLGSQMAFLPGDRRVNYLSAVQPFDLGKNGYYACGLSWTDYRLANPLELRTKDTPDPESQASVSDDVFDFCGAGWIFPKRLALGLGLKVYQDRLADFSSSGFGVDAGILIKGMPGFDAAFCLVDAYNKVSWSTGRDESAPTALRLGCAWTPDGGKWPLLLAAEFEKSLSQGIKPRLGLEYRPLRKTLNLRAGFDNGAYAAGMGVRMPFDKLWAGLDFAASTDRTQDWDFSGLGWRASLTLGYEVIYADTASSPRAP